MPILINPLYTHCLITFHVLPSGTFEFLQLYFHNYYILNISIQKLFYLCVPKTWDWALPFPEFPAASSRQVWLDWAERRSHHHCNNMYNLWTATKWNKINITSSLLSFDLPSYMHHDQYLYGDIMVEMLGINIRICVIEYFVHSFSLIDVCNAFYT